MGPTSQVFASLLIVGFGGLIYVVGFRGRWWLKVPTAAAAFMVATAFGVSVVNDYYGYYRTWGALATDLSGGPASTRVSLGGQASAPTAGPAGSAYPLQPLVLPTPAAGQGELLTAQFAGPRSGISRQGYIYLPAAYFAPGNARRLFPVLELFHGSPGKPADWLTNLGVTAVLNEEIRARRVGPMVLVIPDIKGGPPRSDDCVNAVGGDQDDTYLTEDVPGDVVGRLRVDPLGPQWATMGFSTGGYCAVNLAVRHPRSYGAAASFDGYYHAEQRAYTGNLFGRRQDLVEGNSPAYVLSHEVVQPLPRLWLQVGTGDSEDTADAFGFHDLVDHLEPTPLVVEPGARHNYPSWERALPTALDWAWSVIGAGRAPGGGISVEPAPRGALGPSAAPSATPSRGRRHPVGAATPSGSASPEAGPHSTRLG